MVAQSGIGTVIVSCWVLECCFGPATIRSVHVNLLTFEILAQRMPKYATERYITMQLRLGCEPIKPTKGHNSKSAKIKAACWAKQVQDGRPSRSHRTSEHWFTVFMCTCPQNWKSNHRMGHHFPDRMKEVHPPNLEARPDRIFRWIPMESSRYFMFAPFGRVSH